MLMSLSCSHTENLANHLSGSALTEHVSMNISCVKWRVVYLLTAGAWKSMPPQGKTNTGKGSRGNISRWKYASASET